MGQAAVDLPDPLNPPLPAAESAGNTDDLLAQMAGEEIDRLLAEQEDEPAVKPAAPRTAVAPAPGSQAGPVGASDQTKASEAAALNGFLGGIAPGSDARPDPVATLAGSAQPPAQTASDSKSTAELLDEELEADKARAALNSSTFQKKPDAGTRGRAAPVPLLLRVLAWVSAPLDACPDHVREAIGKIAIITAVNALAVLFYVLFIRSHHG